MSADLDELERIARIAAEPLSEPYKEWHFHSMLSPRDVLDLIRRARLGDAVRAAVGDVSPEFARKLAREAELDGHFFTADVVRVAADAIEKEGTR